MTLRRSNRSRRAALARSAVALWLAGWAACRDAVPPAGSDPAGAELVDLDASLEAVRVEFNAHRGENRFLTLLAPT
jgi:hypothetical protein